METRNCIYLPSEICLRWHLNCANLSTVRRQDAVLFVRCARLENFINQLNPLCLSSEFANYKNEEENRLDVQTADTGLVDTARQRISM